MKNLDHQENTRERIFTDQMNGPLSMPSNDSIHEPFSTYILSWTLSIDENVTNLFFEAKLAMRLSECYHFLVAAFYSTYCY